MALLVERLMNKLGKDINSSILWAKLKSMYNLRALDESEPTPLDLEEETDFALPESYLNHKMTSVDSTDDVEDESESKSESGSKSETPVSVLTSLISGASNILQVVKEVESSRTRTSTPARETRETSGGNNTLNETNTSTGSSSTKRTQPKRTRASTSTNDTPSSSPSTPTPTGTKRRRI